MATVGTYLDWMGILLAPGERAPRLSVCDGEGPLGAYTGAFVVVRGAPGSRDRVVHRFRGGGGDRLDAFDDLSPAELVWVAAQLERSMARAGEVRVYRGEEAVAKALIALARRAGPAQ